MKTEDLLFQFRYEVLLSNGKKEFVRYRITAELTETTEYLQKHGLFTEDKENPKNFSEGLRARVFRFAKEKDERVYAFDRAPYSDSKDQLIEEVQNWIRSASGDLSAEVVDIHLCFKCENYPV